MGKKSGSKRASQSGENKGWPDVAHLFVSKLFEVIIRLVDKGRLGFALSFFLIFGLFGIVIGLLYKIPEEAMPDFLLGVLRFFSDSGISLAVPWMLSIVFFLIMYFQRKVYKAEISRLAALRDRDIFKSVSVEDKILKLDSSEWAGE